jgi:hypothetical protein
LYEGAAGAWVAQIHIWMEENRQGPMEDWALQIISKHSSFFYQFFKIELGGLFSLACLFINFDTSSLSGIVPEVILNRSFSTLACWKVGHS